MSIRSARTIITASALALTAGVLIAGPLSPPAGSVTSTYKTLSEVEPRTVIGPATPGDATAVYRITQPGSYYLAGNIAGVAGKSAIRIETDGVTLDLNGFSLDGVQGAQYGIACEWQERVEIRGGAIYNWPLGGVYAASSTGVTARDLRVQNCGDAGIRVGAGAIIRDCTAANCTGPGIWVGQGSSVTGCVSRNNSDGGFALGEHARAQQCVAELNNGPGFRMLAYGSMNACTAAKNTGNGVAAAYGCEISGSSASDNTTDGFQFGAMCALTGNTAAHNAGSGFRGLGEAARAVVRGNNATRNGSGIRIDGNGFLIMGNTCADNTTNYIIASGNRLAAIVTMPLSGAVSGNTGGAALTIPDANYAY